MQVVCRQKPDLNHNKHVYKTRMSQINQRIKIVSKRAHESCQPITYKPDCSDTIIELQKLIHIKYKLKQTYMNQKKLRKIFE